MNAERKRPPQGSGAIESAAPWLRRLPLGRHTRPRLRRLYHAALAFGTLGRGMRRRAPNGETVFVAPAHRHINWNATELDAFRRAIAPGCIALDIGANVGAYSLLLGRWVGASGHVFSFEPSPAVFEGLCSHVRLNEITERVTPVQSAVADAIGSSPFVLEKTAGEGRLITVNGAAPTVTVPVTTIDAFCDQTGITPAFIKVDVEGAELDVLRGGRSTIERTRGRLALFVELHPSLWPERGIARSDLELELDQLGLAIVSLVRGADPWRIEGVAAQLVAR